MATDYSSHKVSELNELLKSRGLPHTGKKAELIARLEAADAESASKPRPEQPKTEPATAPKASAKENLAAAGGKGQPANPAAVPNQVQGEDPTEDKGAEVTGGATEATAPNGEQAEEAPKQDFSAGVKELTLEEEMERRRKRAERFGTGTKKAEEAPESDDTEKLLARQKRFGGVTTGGNVGGVDSLNQALPERQKKRGRGDGEGDRDSKRRDSKRRGGRGQDTKSSESKPAEPVAKTSSEQAEKDRLAAEKRKSRFATSTA